MKNYVRNVLLSFCIIFSSALALTISTPTVWNNFTVYEDVYVTSILTINPGAQIDYTGSYRIYIQAGGQLIANGTAANKIQMYSNGAVVQHNGIQFGVGSLGGSMTYVTMTGVNGQLYGGIDIRVDNVTLDHVSVTNRNTTTGKSYYINDCSPLLTYCQAASGRYGFDVREAFTSKLPRIYNCDINANTGHIYFTTSHALTLYAEGNYYGVGASYGTAPITVGTVDAYPYLTGTSYSPYSSVTHTIQSGAGAAGTINGNMVLGNDRIYNVQGGSLTIANAGNLRVGYNPITATYSGNSRLRLDPALNIDVQAGGNFTSNGTATLYNYIEATSAPTVWGSLILNSGSTGSLSFTDISYATIGVNDQAGSSISNLSFSRCNTAIASSLVNNGIYNNNTISAGTVGFYAFDLATNCTVIGNTFTSSVPNAIRITAGAPTIQQNSIGTTALLTVPAGVPLTITGGSIPAGNFVNNNFTNALSRVAASGATGVVYLQNNFWGVTTPVTANFSGTNEIDYEPWYNAAYPGGTLTSQKPVTVNCILPLTGSNLMTIPTEVTFNISDIGYRNGTPMRVQFQLSDGDPTFAATMYNTTSLAIYAPEQVISYPVAGLNFGHTYYWRAWAENTTDGQGWSATPNPIYSFSVQQPEVQLILSTNPAITAANAGGIVTYQIDFTNTGTFGVSNALITAILPDDVYANGTFILENISGKGNVVVTAYSDIAGTIALGSTPVITSDTSFTNIVGAANNTNIRRYNILVPVIPVGASGRLRYQTVVK